MPCWQSYNFLPNIVKGTPIKLIFAPWVSRGSSQSILCFFFSNDLLTSGRGKNKRSENLEKGCVHFMMYITVVGVQKIYQGDTVSYIMTEMLVVRCCKRAKRRERIAKLAGKCSFLRGEKSRTTSGTRVARCKLQQALYRPSPPPPTCKKRFLSRMDFSIPPEVVRVADGWHSRRLACLRTTQMPATRTASQMLRTKQETNFC